MTNGEKLKEVFPNAEIGYGLRGVVAVTFIHKTIFNLDWWNAEYKEPTTKNDVPDINVGKIDYVSRKEVIEQCQEWRNHEFVTMTNPYYYLEKRLNNLISVTPLSSGLEKNSKKLEKDFGESDCISREQAKTAIWNRRIYFDPNEEEQPNE